MKKFIFALSLFCFASVALSQVSNPSIIVVSTDPSGSASCGLPMQYNIADGTVWYLGSPVAGSCTWTQLTGGGGSSVGTAGQLQMVGSTTGSFAASALTDNGTKVSSSEPITATGLTVSTTGNLTIPLIGQSGGGNALVSLQFWNATTQEWVMQMSGASHFFAWNNAVSGANRFTMTLSGSTTIDAESSSAIQLNLDTNSGTGGVTFGSGGSSPTTVGSVSSAGLAQMAQYSTNANCSSSASPAVCAAASAGSAALPTNAVSSSIVVQTTAVTANSQIFISTDDTLGTKLGVTCNSTVATLVGGLTISARTAGTSFTVANNVAVVTNPLCISWFIVN